MQRRWIGVVGAVVLAGAEAAPAEAGFEVRVERVEISGGAPFVDEFDDGARSEAPTSHFVDRGATEVVEQGDTLRLTHEDGTDPVLGSDLVTLDRPLRSEGGPAVLEATFVVPAALRPDQQFGIGVFWKAPEGAPVGPLLLYVTRRSSGSASIPFSGDLLALGAGPATIPRIGDLWYEYRGRPTGYVDYIPGRYAFLSQLTVPPVAACGTADGLVVVSSGGCDALVDAVPEAPIHLRLTLDGAGAVRAAYRLDADPAFRVASAWQRPEAAAGSATAGTPRYAGLFAGSTLPSSPLAFELAGLADASGLERDGTGALVSVVGEVARAVRPTLLEGEPEESVGTFSMQSADGRDLRVAPGSLEVITGDGTLRGVAEQVSERARRDPTSGRPLRAGAAADDVCALGTEPACLPAQPMGSEAPGENQAIYTAVCSSSIGFNSLDRSVCAQSVFMGTTLPLPGVSTAQLLSLLLSGSATAVATAVNPAFLGPNAAVSRIPIVSLAIGASDGTPTGPFSLQGPNYGEGLVHNVRQTLDQVLTPAQRGLFGCGPFHGPSCDGGIPGNPFGGSAPGGLDVRRAEAAALVQAWLPAGGDATDASVAQPGTLGASAGPGCVQATAGGSTTTLPGCRTPGDPAFDASVDGADPASVHLGFPFAQVGIPFPGAAVLGPIAFASGQPFTGQAWQSETAALSFNLQTTLVALSAGGRPLDATESRFDPADGYRAGTCSYVEPWRCTEVRAFRSAVVDELPDDPSGAPARRFLWETGALYRITEATGAFEPILGGALVVPGPVATAVPGAAALVPILIPAVPVADADADGILDAKDRCPDRADGFQDDADGDAHGDACDVCTLESDPSQRDTDGDGFGNACDPDLNGDGIVNFFDLALFKARFLGTDPDADLNGDGVVNFSDLALLKRHMFQAPGPSAFPAP